MALALPAAVGDVVWVTIGTTLVPVTLTHACASAAGEITGVSKELNLHKASGSEKTALTLWVWTVLVARVMSSPVGATLLNGVGKLVASALVGVVGASATTTLTATVVPTAVTIGTAACAVTPVVVPTILSVFLVRCTLNTGKIIYAFLTPKKNKKEYEIHPLDDITTKEWTDLCESVTEGKCEVVVEDKMPSAVFETKVSSWFNFKPSTLKLRERQRVGSQTLYKWVDEVKTWKNIFVLQKRQTMLTAYELRVAIINPDDATLVVPIATVRSLVDGYKFLDELQEAALNIEHHVIYDFFLGATSVPTKVDLISLRAAGEAS
mmetsp:Transcript_27301/g.30403  ORF Transcript_27301/g.30403 Transcript_27301/m.30403 type:complete len:322 (+) Transcript_27301:47-1012(+)